MVRHLRGRQDQGAASILRRAAGKPAIALGTVFALLLLIGCSGPAVTGTRPPIAGPARVQPSVVRRYAHWFDVNDPRRPPGSQQELVASSYLLGRLEQAGYLVKLDPVPVGNLLHSTNVIALAPSGRSSVVVIVDYDTSEPVRSDGPAIGTFLEVARALRVLVPQHSVEFAALGAEHVAVDGGQVGARSLIELLKQQKRPPQIIRLTDIQDTAAPTSVAGPAAGSVRTAAAGLGEHVQASAALTNDVFTAAGFPETVISGGPSTGRVLLGYLHNASHTSPGP